MLRLYCQRAFAFNHPVTATLVSVSDAPIMLNVTEVLTTIISDRATAHFRAAYPRAATMPLDLAVAVAHTALAAIGRSDALYHNVEHTTHVTLVGLQILRAKQERERNVSAATWCNTVIALLCHDIGYVRGLCRADTTQALVTGSDGPLFKACVGTSDAVLMPIHVNRGKRFIEEQFGDSPLVDIGFVNACIERTRFPVPDDPWYAQTSDYPGLVRAADLIGQLSDPRYLNKLAAIFYEFEEIGFNDAMGYARPGDLLSAYPGFFDKSVAPYINPAVDYLARTGEGRDILLHLHANLETARSGTRSEMRAAVNS